MSEITISPSGGAQLLDRAVILLDLVADGEAEGVTLKQLASLSGLNTATCHRILNTLVGHKLLARDDKKKCYRLGARMAIYGARAARGPGLISRCEMVLTRIRRKTGDTIHLLARFNHDSVCLDRRDGECVVPTLTGSIGGSVPLGVGPGSISMLAYLDEDEQDFIIRANLERYSAYRDLTAAKVRRLITDTRERGYAVDIGELIPGIAGVAMPILTEDNRPTASLGFTLLCAKLAPGVIEQYAALLKEEIGGILGQ
ncbi:IclR family transcriptional regulator [Allorhizobium borbori]|uniref:DNA-binding IclR family transcriptional regulator n=1 Tax=Allorhizobium borbori TaxID=485907 RepID=A0A7W6K1C4_9HYPH|nr:IclR family transcriptional regulator [Allorhizobium borbori]MBB4103361.1 DNA-binding IclR family transcriptional regulator [Allorhizobium borbori]